MRIAAAFIAISALVLCAAPGNAQALKARGDTVELRSGPGAEHPVKGALSNDDVVLQVGRQDSWIATNRGWAQADSVEWVFPLRERGDPSVSVSTIASIDFRVRKYALSPRGS